MFSTVAKMYIICVFLDHTQHSTVLDILIRKIFEKYQITPRN